MSYTRESDPVDVIVVGMGATGGTAVKVLQGRRVRQGSVAAPAGPLLR